MAEAQRFELWNPFGSPVFKTEEKQMKISVIRESAENLIKFNTKKNQGVRKLLIASIPSIFARKFSVLPTC
ncbi:hypothetical protein EYI06_13150 [Escherichia coli]|nr:hypothetical protein AKK22_07920 [Escherichia coli]EFX6076750.1 hypothetical protein [Shigella boydii]EAB0666969.1 hypothetical protein [Escherichia coli]EAB0960027.1 hypothetical protein [Escherichia coli]EEV5746230.1 hypothetical protein [Escherichia coli]